MDGLLEDVAEDHVVTVEEMKGRSRAKYLTDARAEFCWRAYNRFDVTLQAIGDVLGGRHYRTVRYLIERHEFLEDAA